MNEYMSADGLSLQDLVARELLPLAAEEPRFIMSVSGGRDSICLLYAAHELFKKQQLQLVAFHVNFHLRGEDSNRDEEFVLKICRKLEVPCFVFSVSHRGKLSQEEARRHRLEASKPLWPGAWLLEAHHADDQIETLLFRLLRGTGLSGLSGMKVNSQREDRRVVRPLLRVHRAQIEAYLDHLKIKFREDLTNAEDKYSRNWIRNKLLPRIEKRFPRARGSILRLQSQILEEDEYFDAECEKIHRLAFTDSGGLRLTTLQSLPKALLKRYLHFYFRRERAVILDRTQIQELSQLIAWGTKFTWNAPQNWVVRLGRDGNLRCLKAKGRSLPQRPPSPAKEKKGKVQAAG